MMKSRRRRRRKRLGPNLIDRQPSNVRQTFVRQTLLAELPVPSERRMIFRAMTAPSISVQSSTDIRKNHFLRLAVVRRQVALGFTSRVFSERRGRYRDRPL